jgi:hypothetical protein
LRGLLTLNRFCGRSVATASFVILFSWVLVVKQGRPITTLIIC